MATVCPIRVLVVEDHPIFAEVLRSILKPHANVKIVAQANNGHQAVMMAGQLQPAVIVMDVSMSGMNGIAATRVIKTHFPHIAVVGLSADVENSCGASMLQAGASEILGKETAVDHLYDAIERAVRTNELDFTVEAVSA